MYFFIALIVILIPVIYFGQKRESEEERERYEKEVKKLEEQLQKKEISEGTYERLRKTLEKEYHKTIRKICEQ